jgi:hypothetical protein
MLMSFARQSAPQASEALLHVGLVGHMVLQLKMQAE